MARLAVWQFLNIFSILILALLVSTTPTFSSEVKKPGFSLTLPDGWVEVSREVIDRKNADTARKDPGFPTYTFEYGFQMGPVRDELEPPYILVYSQNAGHMTKAEFQTLESKLLSRLNQTRSRVGPSKAIESHTNGTEHRDLEKSTLMNTTVDLPNIGPSPVVTGVFLTENGTINFYGLSLESDAERDLPIIEDILNSITISPSMAHHDKFSDHFIWFVRRPKLCTVVLLILFGIVSISFRRRRFNS